jgi:hypothetical protein
MSDDGGLLFELSEAELRDAVARLTRERDAAKRGWDGALAATHDLARQVADMMREREAARLEAAADHEVKRDWVAVATTAVRERDEARAALLNDDAATRLVDALALTGKALAERDVGRIQRAEAERERDEARAEVEQLRRDLFGALAMLEAAKERVR